VENGKMTTFVLTMRLLLAFFIFFSTCSLNYHAQGETENKILENITKIKDENKKLTAFDEAIQESKWGLKDQHNQLVTSLKKWGSTVNQTEIRAKIQIVLSEIIVENYQIDKLPNLLNTVEFNVLTDDLWRHRYFRLKARIYLFNKNWTEASKIIRRQLTNTKGKNKNKRLSEWNMDLSELKMALQQKDSAYYYANMAIQYAKRSDSKIVLFQGLLLQADLHAEFEDYDESINKLLQLLQLSKAEESLYFQQVAYREIANLSVVLGNFRSGLPYIRRAADIADVMKDSGAKWMVKVVQSYYDIENDNLVLARKNLVDAYLFFKSRNDWSNLAETFRALAFLELYGAKNEISFLDNAQQSLNFSSWNMYPLSANLLRIDMAQVQFENGQNELSLQTLERVKDFFEKERQNSIQLIDVYKIYAHIYERKGDEKKSLFYLNKYLELSERNIILKAASSIEKQTENNLREEREKLIQIQNASIAKQEQEKEVFKLKRDRQLFLVIILVVLLILGFAIMASRFKQQQLKQQQREMELSQSLLRSQMNPHFIFNAMSVIQSSIYSDEPAKTSKFLVNFSKLIRLILENSPKEFISLELEHEILEKYLITQKMRFENRFEYKLTIEEGLLNKHAMVPPMITQPFVENAIEHGQLHKQTNGQIEVFFSEKEGMLSIEVRDNGVGRKKSGQTKKMKNHKSMAIDITTDRILILNRKYKKEGKILIDDFNKEDQTGTIVEILLPMHVESY
jgi:hypothetical protein